MPHLIPKQFERRERIITAVAIGCGLLAACIACLTTFGAYGGWILLAIIGLFTFLAVGRQERAFYAGVFGSTLWSSMSLGLCVVKILRYHEPLGKDDAFVISVLFLWLVIVPISLGLFISWIRRHEDRVA